MTQNHGFETPEKGTSNWQVPLNSNFQKLDTGVEIRGEENALESYTPKAGAKFLATDTGNVYVADGSSWSRVQVPAHDHASLNVTDTLRIPVREADPSDPDNGELWFRSDEGAVRIQTSTGPQPLAFASTNDQTNDDGSDSDGSSTSFDVTESFDDSSWTGTFGDKWDYGFDGNTTITDAAGRNGSQLQATVPGGENRGLYTIHDHESRAGSAPTKMYHRFYMRFEPGMEDAITDDGKLPGFAGRNGTDEGAGGSPAKGTGWSARMGWDDPEDHSGSGMALDYYVYHMDASGSYGDHEYWGIQLQEGTWYEIEQYIDLGTPGENDGVLRGWVDGNREYERTDLRFRESGGNDVQWSWWDFYHGGGETPNGDIHVQFDDLQVNRGGMP